MIFASFTNWLKRFVRGSRSGARVAKSRRGYRPWIELLEDRIVPAFTKAIDVPFGVFTPAQIALLESAPADVNLSSPSPALIQGLDGGHQPNPLTIVLDFKESTQSNTSDFNGNVVGTFDVTAYGFSAAQYATVVNAIAAEVDEDYFAELRGTVAGPVGQDLAIDFVLGDIGVAPSNGATNYYYVQIGSGVSGPEGGNPDVFGVARVSGVRTGTGSPGALPNGAVVGSIFTNHIRNLTGLSPSNALTSGNLIFTTHAVSGTLSHEIGHTLSLSHISKIGSTQAVAGTAPLMGTGAIDLPAQDRITDRSFSLTGVDGGNFNAPRQHVQQLATAVGLHDMESGSVAVPVPLTATSPAGSLVYDSSVSGAIAPAGDTDTFTLNIDANQKITVVVRPTTVTTLRPTITLQDPGSAIIGTATAPALNRNAILQTITTTTAGLYTITVGGDVASVGNYMVQVILNAAEELERNAGQSTNNTAATAQNINPAFLTLGGAASRGAVMGAVASTSDLDFYSMTLTAGDTLTVAIKGINSAGLTAQLRDSTGATVLGTAIAGPSNLDKVLNNFVASTTGTYNLVIGGTVAGATYSAVITLNADFDTEANNSFAVSQRLGGSKGALGFVQGGSATTYNFETGQQGWTINNTILGAGSASGLWHLSTRRSGDANHSAVTSFYYGSETTGNYSTGARNAGAIVSPSFVVAPGATVDFKYFLDTEGNTSYDQAILQISANGGATWTNLLGPLAEKSAFTSASASLAAYVGQTVQVRFFFDTTDSVLNAFEGWYVDDVQVGAAANEDWYSFAANAGDRVALQSSTPGDGAGQFVNTLNAKLELYDPANILVASGVALADGRNESINHTALTSGFYRLRVLGEDGSSGEYFIGFVTPDSPPTIDGTTPLTSLTDKQTASPFSSVAIGDVDSPPQSLTVLVSLDTAAKGVFTTASLTASGFTDQGGGVYRFSGMASAATSAIRQLAFMPTENRVAPGTIEDTTFTISANDGSAPAVTNNSTVVRTTSVNDAPTIAGTTPLTRITDKQTASPFSSVSIGDVDSPPPSLTVLVSLDTAAKGVFTTASLAASGFTDQGGGVYRFTGMASAATSAIRQLVFMPTEDRLAPGTSQDTTFTILVNDGIAAGVTDSSTVVRTTAAIAPVFSDDFNRPDQPLGSPWIVSLGTYNVLGYQSPGYDGKAVGQDAVNLATVADVSLADVAVQADSDLRPNIDQPNLGAGLVARYQADGSYYLGMIYGVYDLEFDTTKFSAYIFKYTAGVGFSQLAGPVTVSDGEGTLRFEVVGSSLKLFGGLTPDNLQLLTYAFDESLPDAGRAGIRSSDQVPIDNFRIDAAAPTMVDLPFADRFTQPDGSQLSRNWTERRGNFHVENNVLASQVAIVNLATLNSTPLADAAVQADINVGVGADQVAGLIARYQPDGTFYLATVYSFGPEQKVSACLFKFVPGAGFTQLTESVVLPGGEGTLRFEVVGDSLKVFFGSDMVLHTFDSAIAQPGLTGIRTYNGATVDAFNLDTVRLTTPALPFEDKFTQPDGSQLSRNWTDRKGSFRGKEGQLVAQSLAISLATVNATLLDAAVQADINVGIDQVAGLIARYQADGSYYLASVYSFGGEHEVSASLFKFVPGVGFTQLVDPVKLDGGEGTLRFEVVGNSLKLYFGTDGDSLLLAVYAFDSSIAQPGLTGLRNYNGSKVDNFNLDAVVLTTPALPFTDTFTRPDGSQLSRNWTERSGNFGVANGAATGKAPTPSIATANTATLANVSVQAVVSVGDYQTAGLIARYQTDGSYYLASVYANGDGAGFSVGLFKFVPGAGHTWLNATNVAIGSATGTLRFVVIDNSLSVFFGTDPDRLDLLINVEDSSLSAAGLTGIRGNLNVRLDDFSVEPVV